MGIMGLMNSKDAQGKDQHNSRAHLSTAKKDTHLKAGLRKHSQLLWLCFPTVLKDEKGKNLKYYKCFISRIEPL